MESTLEKIIKLFLIIVLVAVIVLLMVTCAEPSKGESYNGPAFYGDTISIRDAQVWERNYTANKISQMYSKFDGSAEIMVLDDPGFPVHSSWGSIQNGKLSIIVNKLEQDELLKWDSPPDWALGLPLSSLDSNKLTFKYFFASIADGAGWDAQIDKTETKGNYILLITNDKKNALMREDISGTNNSFSCEWVFFVYVDRACKITGASRVIESFSYTLNAFTLNLYAGWNTICLTQTYTTVGKSTFSMAVKNPDLKWVLIPTGY